MRRTTHIAQKSVSAVDNRIDYFLRFINRMRRSRNYDFKYIANMGETPVWMEMPGKSTLDTIGSKSFSVTSTGHEKERLSVMLSAYTDGTKMSPFVLLPGVKPLPKTDIPNGIVVHMCGSGKKSWADETTISIWLKTIWGRNNTDKRLLVWDTFRGHLTEKVKDVARKKCNTDLAYIPGGCTSRLQPADVSWNKPFKSAFAEKYDDWLFSGEVSLTNHGNRRPPPKKLILRWIKESWLSISPDIIRKSFKKCGITNALDGTEDDLFMAESDTESDNEPMFEGFTPSDVDVAQAVYDNTSADVYNVNIELSESSDSNSDMDEIDDYYDCASPGH